MHHAYMLLSQGSLTNLFCIDTTKDTHRDTHANVIGKVESRLREVTTSIKVKRDA